MRSIAWRSWQVNHKGNEMTEFLTASVVLNLYLLYCYLVLHSQFRKTVRMLFHIAQGQLKIIKTADGWEVKTTKEA